jgi:DNA-binding NtrC family response regulator
MLDGGRIANRKRIQKPWISADRMSFQVLIVSGDDGFSDPIQNALQEEGIPSLHFHSMETLIEGPPSTPAPAILIDLDTVGIDVQTVAQIQLAFHGCPLLAASKRSFHPELEEVIRNHFFACMGNPPDRAEMIYLLGAVIKDKDASEG